MVIRKLFRCYTKNAIAFLVGAYVLTAVTSFVFFQCFQSWSNDLFYYLRWPLKWLDYTFVWLSRESMMSDGLIMVGLLLFFSSIIVWGIRKRQKWYGVAAVFIVMYLQIFIIFITDLLGV